MVDTTSTATNGLYARSVNGQTGATKPRIADLFCGAGGAGMGLHRAGFEVVGFDLKPQPNYPFEFHHADALDVDLRGFDAIWASPPCQRFSQAVKKKYRKARPNLIPAIRIQITNADVPYMIENVPTARRHLREPVQLCGSAFGLPIRRHRLFESNVWLWSGQCSHEEYPRIYPPAWNRTTPLRVLSISGGYQQRQASLDEHRAAMGVDWDMTCTELSEAIPPAYSEYLGKQLMAVLS